jgi:hypothetical protein
LHANGRKNGSEMPPLPAGKKPIMGKYDKLITNANF